MFAEKYKLTKNEWHFIVFTMEGDTNTGTFVINDKYGYQNASLERLVVLMILCTEYINFSLQTLIGRIFQNKNFKGLVEEIYELWLTHCQKCFGCQLKPGWKHQLFENLYKISDLVSNIPSQKVQWGNCELHLPWWIWVFWWRLLPGINKTFYFFIKVLNKSNTSQMHVSQGTFLDAELNCLTATSYENSDHRAEMIFSEKQKVYEYFQESLKGKIGQIQFWVGVENREGRENWTTRYHVKISDHEEPQMQRVCFSQGTSLSPQSDLWENGNPGAYACGAVINENGGYVCRNFKTYSTSWVMSYVSCLLDFLPHSHVTHWWLTFVKLVPKTLHQITIVQPVSFPIITDACSQSMSQCQRN